MALATTDSIVTGAYSNGGKADMSTRSHIAGFSTRRWDEPKWQPDCRSIHVKMPSLLSRASATLHRIWGRVRWRMAAILVFTGMSTLLVVALSIAALNVLVRREASSVVEKEIALLLNESRSVAPTILDHAANCTATTDRLVLPQSLLAYTAEVFPQSRASVTIDGPNGVRFHSSGPARLAAEHPNWLESQEFSGLVVEQGEVGIRHLLSARKGACTVTVAFSLPLGARLAARLATASGVEITAVRHQRFRVHPLNQRILQTIRSNFIPGKVQPASVVLTVRNWKTGGQEDWIVASVRGNYSRTFEGMARLGGQLADWVWLLIGLCAAAFLLDGAGMWTCVRFGKEIATSVDDLSIAAAEIAAGNFSWRTAVRSKSQLGELTANFNEMAIALEKVQKEQAERLRLDGELQAARSVQQYLYPRHEPVLLNATVSGQTLPARVIGGDLYDFIDLGHGRIGMLCADVSGKSIPAALMMANLQALTRAHASHASDVPSICPAHFVEVLNTELAGRFGTNRYATLIWAVYDTQTRDLTYVGAGHPAPIVVHASGAIDRLSSEGFPVGMFPTAQYVATTVKMRPGSCLVIFTDGVTDAADVAGEEFGEDRLLARCKAIEPGWDARETTGHLMHAVADWSSGAERFDDTTVVVLRIAPDSM
ncbi:PP2C family protein-serine/threonine phosphatase [Paludibaculum fermentans]|uniref:PP2C family protein-serine/threonine phosphatase n=1 Tax=Paludibaculum fermentans TaxID=1473598 RepID=UPI003EBB7568